MAQRKRRGRFGVQTPLGPSAGSKCPPRRQGQAARVTRRLWEGVVTPLQQHFPLQTLPLVTNMAKYSPARLCLQKTQLMELHFLTLHPKILVQPHPQSC